MLIKSVSLSLLLISIIHYLYIFLKNNLHNQKLKTLLTIPKEYEDILELINKGNREDTTSSSENTTKISDLPNSSMKVI